MENDENNVNIDHSLPSQIHEYSKRKLYGQFIPHAEVNCPNAQTSNTSAVRCVKCQNLDLCKSLNGYSLQEVYYPNNLDISGTCAVVESLAKQMNNEIFGPTKTFRDIPVCREAVMEYLCLFWGSNNRMYTNCCVFSESTSQGEIRAPRPPCRSFCVQIADLCANDDSFVQLCSKMVCPQRQCVTDPTISGTKLNAGLNCSMPFSLEPYTSSGRLSFPFPIYSGFDFLILVVCMIFISSKCI